MKSMMRRSLAIVMVLAMLLSVLAVPAFAADVHVHDDNDPCEHAGQEGAIKQEEKAATCQSLGGTWNTCTICGDVWVTNATPKTEDHQWSDEPTTVTATCWREGYTANVCDTCGATTGKTNVVPQYTHTVYDAVNNPTGCLYLDTEASTLEDCINGGVVVYRCRFENEAADASGDKCTYVVAPEYKEPAGHKHVLNTVEYQAPSCSESGWVIVECTVCPDEFKVYAAPAGHSWHLQEEVPSTCSLAGYHKGAYCDAWWLVWDEEGNATKVTCSAYYKGDAPTADNVVVPAVDLDAESLRHDSTAQHTPVYAAKDATVNGEIAYQAATCNPALSAEQQKGWWYKVCDKNCGWFEKEILTVQHEKDPAFTPQVTEPTCTEDGYTTYLCAICTTKYQADFVPAAHKYAASAGAANVVYTFVKDGKTFIRDGLDLLWIHEEGTATFKLDYIPYMTDDLTDAKAAALLADGYVASSWVAMTEASCGVKGYYAHYCTVCDAGEFLTIDVQHTWDGDANDVKAENFVNATCTTPGGYMGTCGTCNEEYLLSAAEAKVEGYNGPVAATQHKKHDGTPAGMTGNVFNVPHDNGQASTCTQQGYAGFDYCDNADCALPTYEEALAAAMLNALPLAPHTYYAANGNVLAPVALEENCMYPAFSVASCVDCGLHIYKDAAYNTTGDKVPYDFMIEGSITKPFDASKHVWPQGDRGYATEPTCDAPGRYNDIQCTVCSKTDMGKNVEPINPGAVPTYNASMTNGMIVNDYWKIVIVEPTCFAPGSVTAVCVACEKNGTTNHASTVIKVLDPTEKHMIKGATYVYNEDGSLKVVNGAYVVSALPTAVTPTTPTPGFTPNAGSCRTDINDLHADYYECATCSEILAIAVALAHTPVGATCTVAGSCSVCHEELTEALGHNMEKTTTIKNDDADCTTEWYYILDCSRCDFTSESQGFVWTDAYKALAEYVPAAAAHTWNIDAPTCTVAQECTVEGCEVSHAALAHLTPTSTYVASTCIKLAHTVYTCARGEACDIANKTVANGVATWEVVDETAVLAQHAYEKVLTLCQTGTCVAFNVEVWMCKDCKGSMGIDEETGCKDGYKAENLKDAAGHKLVKDDLDPTCTVGGYYQDTCKVCYNRNLDDAGETGLWDVEDWKGDLGYTEKEMRDPTGHWYVKDGETERTYFEINCVDLKANNDPTCGDCKVQFKEADYHAITREYDKLPTCTEDGLTWEYCTEEGCGYKDILKVAYATGHTGLVWVTAAPATCCAAGSKYLACTTCAVDGVPTAVKAGEFKIVDGEKVYFTASDLTDTITKLDHHWVKDSTKTVPATVHAAGSEFYYCDLTCGANGAQCTETKTEPIAKLEGVAFSATVNNAIVPATGANKPVFVNGGMIAYTVKIDAEAKEIGMINVFVSYNTNVLTYVDFDLGADNANLFGTKDASGQCDTMVGANGNGLVSIFAVTSFNENGEYVNATVNAEEEFVTLYFRINSDVMTDDITNLTANYTDFNTYIEIVSAVAAPHTDVAANAYESHVDAVVAVRIEKLGDVNVAKDAEGVMTAADGKINMYDVVAIQNIILEGGYDARADINQDGVVNNLDLIAVKKYIVFVHSYADMVA